MFRKTVVDGLNSFSWEEKFRSGSIGKFLISSHLFRRRVRDQNFRYRKSILDVFSFSKTILNPLYTNFSMARCTDVEIFLFYPHRLLEFIRHPREANEISYIASII